MRTNIALAIVMLVCSMAAVAQPRRPQNPERFDRFRKMKLIEVLKLDEDQAARFVAKETAHEDAVAKFMKQRNELLDGMRKTLRDSGEANDLKKSTDQALAVDEQIYKERRRYQEDLRSFLAPDKFAKYLVFEREFGREVRDAIGNMARDRRQGRENN